MKINLKKWTKAAGVRAVKTVVQTTTHNNMPPYLTVYGWIRIA